MTAYAHGNLGEKAAALTQLGEALFGPDAGNRV
jgi:hypothetical protein